ncbi:MAG: hypothetical protein IJK60_01045 [Clostridia bacterium]|nr:hypothetical protein [Clostridia bacterium]
MLYVKTCKYNLDTGRLEMEDISGNHYWIDIYAVEYECADNMYQRSSLDYLLYNEPIKYINLLLDGKLKEYVHSHPIYLED